MKEVYGKMSLNFMHNNVIKDFFLYCSVQLYTDMAASTSCENRQ